MSVRELVDIAITYRNALADEFGEGSLQDEKLEGALRGLGFVVKKDDASGRLEATEI